MLIFIPTEPKEAALFKADAGILIGLPSKPCIVTVPSSPGWICPNWTWAITACVTCTGLPSKPVIVMEPKKDRYVKICYVRDLRHKRDCDITTSCFICQGEHNK